MINQFALRYLVLIISLLFIVLSIFLWMQVPDLFLYFNQAFCSH